MTTIKAFLAIAIAITITSVANAQNYNTKLDGPFTVTNAIRINGVCEMCKQRIETAVKALPGIWSADWNVNSKVLNVTYNRAKTNPVTIEKTVAAVGQDTEKFKAPDLVYSQLPDCCHYTRKN